MWRCYAISVLGVLVIAATPCVCGARTWTDRKGRQVEADYVEYKDGKVTIKRESDGKLFDLPLELLSDADQAFVRSQAEQFGPVHLGANARGDTVLWKNGSIWKGVTVHKLDSKEGQPVLTIKDVPKGFKEGQFKDVIAVSLRGGKWPPPEVKTATSALAMYDMPNMSRGSVRKPKAEAYQDWFTSKSGVLGQGRFAKPPYSGTVVDEKTGKEFFAQFSVTIPFLRIHEGKWCVYICPNEGGGIVPEGWYTNIDGAYFDRKKDKPDEGSLPDN